MEKDGTIQNDAAQEAGAYFRHMAQFVGFDDEDAAAIKESQLVIEKHIPNFVAQFYDHLLRYPPTRKYFIKKSGKVDDRYLELRMTHLTTFWRHTASGKYDDEYANYVDKVGQAHTSRGADPDIYIAERYVIGQVGFMQHAVTEALHQELHEADPDLEARATKAWNLLLRVILEMLSRSYSDEHEAEEGLLGGEVDQDKVHQLAVDTYKRGLRMFRSIEYEDFEVVDANEIADGERKLMRIGGRSIGIFHHGGEWYAVRNYCLHRSGPVATGDLEGDVLSCPWHGYQYDVKTGEFLLDPAVKLETYQVEIRDGKVHVQLPTVVMDHGRGGIAAKRMVSDTEEARKAKSASQIRPGLRWPVLIVWFLVAAAYVALFISSVPILFQRASTLASPPMPEGIPAEPFTIALAQVGLTPETFAIYVVTADIIAFLAFAVIGLLILLRRSDEWIGIASSIVLIAFGAVATTSVNLVVNNLETPGIGLEFASGFAWIGFFVFMTIFPDGRFVPRWAAVLGLIGFVFLAADIFFLIPARLDQLATVILLALFAIAPYSAIYRYRRVSNPIERQRTKWVVASFAAAFIYSFLSFGLIPALFPSLTQANVSFVIFMLVDIALNVVLFATIPIAIGVAIFRYRLWDVDVLVNRGLVYALLTGSLIAIYLLFVTAIQFLLRTITGQESPLAVVISTLAIAALFNPLRQRIQAVIDRGLYRRKYDAERTLEAFGATVRDEVDLNELSVSLLEIVDRSLQPSGAELWLKEIEGSQVE